VKRLLEHGSKFNPQGKDELDYLASVAEAGHLDLAKLLLDKGLDLSARGSFKNTPLLAAACKGQVDLVRLFLDKGADVNVGGFGNETALTCAFKNHHTEIMNLLISRGADVNVKRSGGDTMLITAVSRGDDPSVTELLLKAGADVHVSDFAGRAALDIACDKNALKVIEVLAKHGANLNRKNPKDGGTALMFAAANGRVEAVKLLLQLGADPNVIDDRGLTALKYATIWKKEPIVDLLKDRAAK
jgi:ankyrin repeat protein